MEKNPIVYGIEVKLLPCGCGCGKILFSPWFYSQESSLDKEEAEKLLQVFRDAERYRKLRAWKWSVDWNGPVVVNSNSQYLRLGIQTFSGSELDLLIDDLKESP